MEAKELIQQIKEKAFKGTDLTGLASMSDEERREFLLQQTERLLSTRENRDVIRWMTGQFIDHCEVKDDNPILDCFTLDLKDGIGWDSEEEEVIARFTVRLAYFAYCMNLACGEYFNTTRYLGINAEYEDITVHDEFWITNGELVNWVKTTPYRRVATGVVSEMINVAGQEAEPKNSAEYDYYYGFFNAVLVDLSDIAQCNDFFIVGIETLEEAERHRQLATQKGLDRECASIVDALCGTLMNDYPEDMVACAKELQQLADSLLQPIDALTMDNIKQGRWVHSTLNACKPVFKKYGIEFKTYRQNISMNYLQDWLHLKYNAKMYGTQF
jgi:hypothetical protein